MRRTFGPMALPTSTIVETPTTYSNSPPSNNTSSNTLIASPWHLLIVLAAQTVISYRGTIHAAQMSSLANPDHIGIYLKTMAFEWLMLGLVLTGVILHGSSLSVVLGERWSNARQFFRDLGIGVMFLIISVVVTSMLAGGADGREAARFILPRGPREFVFWVALSVTAGICEEALFRGYLQRQFTAITRNAPLGIVISATAFGAAHSYQGPRQAVQIALLGAMAGALAYWRKS